MQSTLFIFPKRVVQGIDRVVSDYPNILTRARAAAVSLTEAYGPVFDDIASRKIVRKAGEVAHSSLVRHAVRRIQNELQLSHPSAYAAIFVGEHTFRKTLLPKEHIRAILECSTIPALLRILQSNLA
jgi:hypothetical protein